PAFFESGVLLGLPSSVALQLYAATSPLVAPGYVALVCLRWSWVLRLLRVPFVLLGKPGARIYLRCLLKKIGKISAKGLDYIIK
ncbi:MAG: hypothetical protein J6W67_07105, partial [Lentisphaeria bacterium]|nr:hypothetical protein [Lentisphaeria bacterium]